eukprot:3694804-Prorocentrum_lima.AAC.1
MVVVSGVFRPQRLLELRHSCRWCYHVPLWPLLLPLAGLKATVQSRAAGGVGGGGGGGNGSGGGGGSPS